MIWCSWLMIDESEPNRMSHPQKIPLDSLALYLLPKFHPSNECCWNEERVEEITKNAQRKGEQRSQAKECERLMLWRCSRPLENRLLSSQPQATSLRLFWVMLSCYQVWWSVEVWPLHVEVSLKWMGRGGIIQKARLNQCVYSWKWIFGTRGKWSWIFRALFSTFCRPSINTPLAKRSSVLQVDCCLARLITQMEVLAIEKDFVRPPVQALCYGTIIVLVPFVVVCPEQNCQDMGSTAWECTSRRALFATCNKRCVVRKEPRLCLGCSLHQSRCQDSINNDNNNNHSRIFKEE